MIIIVIFLLLTSTCLSNSWAQDNQDANLQDRLVAGEFKNNDLTQENQISTRAPGNSISIQPPEVTDQSVMYAIICPSNLTETLKPLAAWKTMKGVPAKIYTIDGATGIYANFTHGDNATKIHDFLASLHENNSNLEWVLLVGDEDIIPSRKVYVNAGGIFGLDDYYYSDHYYAGLNNSWDQDNDGIYGEQKGDVNWYADLYVGRLPVNNVSEGEIVVEKILDYEYGSGSGPWMRNATFWSGLLDGPNNQSAYQGYKDNAIKITNKILQYVPDQMTINHLYDYNESDGGNYSLENDNLYHNSAKSSFYAGHSIINFAGQAYYTGDELAHYMDETGMSAAPDGFGPLFSYNDGKYAYNGHKLPLMYLSTCSVNFTETDDSNLEQLLTAPDGGVIGLIGNSGKSYRGETLNGSSFGNWWLDEHFWKLFFNDTYQPGRCLYNLKKSYVINVINQGVPYIQMAVANLVGYNLLGDPELNIWTDIPKDLTFEYSVVNHNGYKLQVKVVGDSGALIEDARVCVFNNEVYAYGTTNSSGFALVDVDPRATGEIELTISAHNYFPSFLNLTYINKPPVIQPLPDANFDEDEVLEDFIDLEDYVTDQDNLFKDLQISISEITDIRAGVNIDNNKNIDILPAQNWHGQGSVTINVSDGYAFTKESFSVTVNPVNDVPIITSFITDGVIQVGDRLNLEIKAKDVENDTLTFSDNAKIFDIDENTGEIDFKAKDDHVGVHEIVITASDGKNSSEINFTLEIEKVDEPSFLDRYWFPMIVIIGFMIVVIIVLASAKSKEKVQKEKEAEPKKKKRSKEMEHSRKKTKKK